MGSMEIGVIIMIFGMPALGVVLLLKFIKAGSKAYNKGKLEAEAEHRREKDKQVS